VTRRLGSSIRKFPVNCGAAVPKKNRLPTSSLSFWVLQTNREAALELRDPGHLPVVEELASDPRIPWRRNVPDVVDDEAMRELNRDRDRLFFEIEGIQGLLETGGPVERLAPGIGGLELQAVRRNASRASSAASCRLRSRSCLRQRCW